MVRKDREQRVLGLRVDLREVAAKLVPAIAYQQVAAVDQGPFNTGKLDGLCVSLEVFLDLGGVAFDGWLCLVTCD